MRFFAWISFATLAMMIDAPPGVRAGPEDEAEAIRMHIAFETGWSLEYIDQLDITDWHAALGYLDGRGRARARERLNE